MSKPLVHDSQIVYEGYYNLKVDTLTLPGKKPIEYTVLLLAKEAAVILAITPQGKLVINREYRHPTERYLLGLPGGRVDPGENPLFTAKRELNEETGYTSEEFIPLGSMYPLPAVCNQRIHYFLAKGATPTGKIEKEPYELIETLEMTQEELFQRIQQGEAVDGILFPALTFYNRN